MNTCAGDVFRAFQKCLLTVTSGLIYHNNHSEPWMRLVVNDVVYHPLHQVYVLVGGYSIEYHPLSILHAFPNVFSHLAL